MNAFAARTSQKTKTLTIFQRTAARDKTVVKDCIDIYGTFIWALAKKFTSSTEEAEAATQEIFIDIWQYSERTKKVQCLT
jgi:RNA polymerase sigma-70 factor (ECF subfamily)